jgi:hypothetical protein
MITTEDERARTGTGASFADAVVFDFCDPEHDLFGLAWMTRLPGANQTRANTMLFANGELVEELVLESDGAPESWEEARIATIRFTTEAPLERWSVAAKGEQASLEFEVEALTAPHELPGEPLGEATGIEQYEQLCRFSGTVDVAGRTYPVRCLGRRVHRWGEFAWNAFARWRNLYAVSLEGHAISVAGALPAGSHGHEDELRSASALDVEDAPPFEDVRLSTVFNDEGFPTKVGLELWRPDDEYPRRLGGELICGSRTRRGGHELVVSFFRWSIDGEPAYGCYELARPA